MRWQSLLRISLSNFYLRRTLGIFPVATSSAVIVLAATSGSAHLDLVDGRTPQTTILIVSGLRHRWSRPDKERFYLAVISPTRLRQPGVVPYSSTLAVPVIRVAT
jgi:hypothetical protein